MRIRCPECDGLIVEGAEWCPQCYADLRRPEPDPEPEPEPAPAPEPEVDPVAAEAGRARHRVAGTGETPPPGWPCPACGTVNGLAADRCTSCGQAFLAPLSEDRGIPALSVLTAMSRGARIGVAIGAIAVVLLLLAAVFWLLG
jgi:hypothetical protein